MTEKELNEQARAAKNAYAREWYAKNKEKCRERNRRYWQRKALLAAQQKADATEG